MQFAGTDPPCVMFEDEHLLVINKPAGLNTHAPSPYASEGIYEWLKHREPRWQRLAIIHRLDKETSGVMVFSKSAVANKSLTAQFATRLVRKRYVLLATAMPRQSSFTASSTLVRAGERYVSKAGAVTGDKAETAFVVVEQLNPAGHELIGSLPEERPNGKVIAVIAEPFTGRTHQIRVQAAENGFPILGDTLYRGAAAERLYLHAAELAFKHPATSRDVFFRAPAEFGTDSRWCLRRELINSSETDSFRLLHGASDGWTGLYVDKIGEFLLAQSAEGSLNAERRKETERLATLVGANGIYHKSLDRKVRQTNVHETSPKPITGNAAPDAFPIRENGLVFEMSFAEGYSTGLFLDQRDNRRRLLSGHVAADFELRTASAEGLKVLNTFAYTCGFSVAAAKGGAHTTSLDLSKKYLEWGKRNFQHNGMDPAEHDFIFGDVFDWFNRFAKKQRKFDTVLLDPPTFSQSRESGVFQAERHYGALVKAALPVLPGGGILFASTNAAGWSPEKFVEVVEESVRTAGRKILKKLYVPQPPDFPASRAEPPYLKTLWLKLA